MNSPSCLLPPKALGCLMLVLLLSFALAVPGAAAQGIDDDPAVREARALLAGQRSRAEEIARTLDDAAGAYERANAHHTRLTDEIDDARADAAQVVDRVTSAKDAFALTVAESYKHAGDDATFAGALTHAPDASTALHRAALVGRIAAGERARIERAQRLVVRADEENRARSIVGAGVASAVADARRNADALTAALAGARTDVGEAGRAVTAAEDVVRARIAQERRQAEARARTAASAARAVGSKPAGAVGSGPLPPVDGKVCPIGAPNGFIDSWGFPRSGGRRHQGVDMFAEHGMPLYAVADGTITKVSSNLLGGLSVNLVDEAGDRYYYAHLSAASVKAGQKVLAGDVVGANGNTGNARATPPHLHWQYHPGNGAPVNPYALASALCR